MKTWTYNVNECNHVPKLMFKHDGISVFAGTKCKIDAPEEFGVLFNLSGFSIAARGKLVTGRRKWEELNRYHTKTIENEVLINWVDGEGLNVEKEFWLKMWALISGEETKSVCFCCLGGHGRTGTAIAILRGLILKESSVVAIRETRNSICEEAIETERQERYIYRLLGEKFPEKTVLLPYDDKDSDKRLSSYERVTRCGICGVYTYNNIHLGDYDFCKICVKAGFKRSNEKGSKRVKKARDYLIGQAKKRLYGKGFSDHEDREVDGKEKSTKGESKKEERYAQGSTCSICQTKVSILYAAEVIDIQGAMLCRECKAAYDIILDSVEEGDLLDPISQETNKELEKDQVQAPHES